MTHSASGTRSRASSTWLLCYDIREPRRLARVHRLMKRNGMPVQYSVFLVHATQARMRRLLVELGVTIDRRCDDVRAYHLPHSDLQYDTVGASILPLDVLPTLALH